jgi:hypothetical protein
MRPRRKLFLVLVFAVLAAAVVWFASWRSPTRVPTLSITVLGYTNSTITDPGDGHQEQWICAGIKLKNEGPETFYAKPYWGYEEIGRVIAQTLAGWTNGSSSRLGDESSPSVIPSGSKMPAIVWLPAGTLRWQYGLSVQVPSLSTRASLKAADARFSLHNLHLNNVFWRLMRSLPDKPGPNVELKSGWFEVGMASNGPPQSQLLQPADAAPGR